MTRLLPLLPFILLLACGGPEHEIADHLLGSWVSDPDATLAEIDVIGGFAPRVRSSLERTLASRTLTYTDSRLTARGGDVTHSGPYRVVEIRGRGASGGTGREIVLDTWDHILGEAVRQSVVVEGDRLWFWKDGGRWREFYRRIQ